MTRLLIASFSVAGIALSVACGQPAEPPTPPEAAELTFNIVPGWTAVAPSSSMRVAEYTLPRADGDEEDASVVVYFFPGGAGSVQANLDRWIGQMEQPDGSPSADVAETSTLMSAGGFDMTLVDVSGTYVAEVTPGATERFNEPGYRLRAAVFETPDGPYYVKMTGPEATVARWESSFTAFLHGIQME
jgi:hypothetical protein